MADSDLGGAAMAYAAKGVPIFPCDPATKRPLIAHGFKDASTDPATVENWWKLWPDASIGMPTGKPSGVWVLDVDDPEAFEANAPRLPRTRRVKTGKGFHLYWRQDEATQVRNAQRHAKTGWPFPAMPGAEVRGDGGYVIVPPSRHPLGRQYTWEDECEPAGPPVELIRIVSGGREKPIPGRSEAHTGTKRHEGGIDTSNGLRALEGECGAIRKACNGEQECTLNTAGLKMGSLVASGGLTHATARAQLLAAGLMMPSFNLHDPWKTKEIAAKIDRALVDGIAGQRSPSGRSGKGSARAGEIGFSPTIHATPYRWPDPRSLPPRQWLLGHWLLRGEVTVIIAPGGTGKSTIGNTIALCLASGRPLLGKPLHRGPQAVWIFNLEDGLDELERQLAAACVFHDIGPEDCGDRLHLDSGLVQPLCTATEDREGFALAEGVFMQLETTIRERQIATVIVDPFVSSHAVQENSNGAIDAIAKRWKRLAQETGCAVALVHHTKKLGGREVTAEDGRGAVALRDAARVVLPLNSMSEKEAEELGIADPQLRRSLVRIDTGKANRAPPDAATWIKLESQSLDNGDDSSPADFVGVASLWERPDVFHGLTTWHLYLVQQGLAAGDWRDNVQAKEKWVGHLIAKVAGLSAEADKGRINAILRTWRKNGALAVEHRIVNGRKVPFAIIGNPIDPSEIGSRPHLKTCGAESAESAGDDPC